MCNSIAQTVGRASYTRAPAMAIGDSMTVGANDLVGGYRVPLQALAPDIQFVGRLDSFGPHEGVGGNTIAQITARVTGSVIDVFKPSVILLLAGHNDLSIPHSASVAAADYCTLATMYANRACAPLVLVSNLPPNANQSTADFNAALPGAFAGAPANVRLVNITSTMTLADDIGGDGVHPNASGYSKMAIAWAANLPAGP